MAKLLHELLAVDGNLKGQAAKARSDLANTFEKKRHHFQEKTVKFKAVEEGKPEALEEQLDLQTTVPKELEWLRGIWAPAFDVAYQIDEANMTEGARSDIVFEDGTVIAKAIPGTALLQLEKRMAELVEFVQKIPTLDPAKGFVPDADRGANIFKAREEVKTRTRKVKKVLTLAPPTEKHPAQVQAYDADEPSGTIHTFEWSGLITVAEKGNMLERAEKLQRAVKQARMRTAQVPVDTAKKIGNTLLKFVFGGE